MSKYNMQATVTLNNAVFYKRLCIQMNNLGAYTACDADPTEDCDKYYKIFDRTAYKACKHYESYELREQNEHVGMAGISSRKTI